MERDKRTMSFQFAKDGRRQEKSDKHQSVKKVAETEWVFPEPDCAVTETNTEELEIKEDPDEQKREIFIWDENKLGYAYQAPPATKKHKALWTQKWLSMPWMLMAAAVSAVCIGVSLGVVMLSFFTGGVDEPVLQPAVEVGTTVVPEDEPVSEFQIFVLQAGAFSTQEAGLQVSETIKQEGYAVIMDDDNETHYLYVGVASSKNQAEQLAAEFKEDGLDVYVKEYVVTKADEEDSTAFEWLNSAENSLMSVIHATTLASLDSSGEENLEVITDELTELESKREASMEGESDELKAIAQTLIAKMAESNQLLSETDEVNRTNQQMNLDALIAYKKGLEQIKQ
ncbi:SPOR domain-containing protein [Alkalicoccobacillus porphyridii]|uniref:SPOR domain-containing protein n=1 Tax=Alkalicoccobacillus porphyridii TaxID=2597270 RepID=A0A553ZXZ6_9BACI|nr:SPOR domain-containing protein [Alkalicoccobacillus porphyridii]TSB46236.1 SPOR domain-containing protein [Alkalicoccobacillus porphyridii]